MMEYLKETQMLNYSHPNIQELIYDKQWKQMNEFNRIQAIYNYVRDEILFGYNSDDIYLLQKYYLMAMVNVILKELYLWHCYVPVIFHVEYMALLLIRNYKEEL